MPENPDDSRDLSRVVYSWEEIDFVWIMAIVVIAAVLIVLVNRLLPAAARYLPERFRFYILPWAPVLRLIVTIAAFVQILPLVIYPTAENLFAILGGAAIAIGFAFKDLASSVIAGIVALFEQPYRTGDWISIDGAFGEVESLGFRSLRMVTPDDTRVTIPHAKIWDSSVFNLNAGQRELQCAADFYLDPSHDGTAVRQALWDVGITSAYLKIDRPVVVIVVEKPWATHYRLKAYPIEGREQFLFVSDLTVRGKAELGRLGIRFATVPAVAGAA